MNRRYIYIYIRCINFVSEYSVLTWYLVHAASDDTYCSQWFPARTIDISVLDGMPAQFDSICCSKLLVVILLFAFYPMETIWPTHNYLEDDACLLVTRSERVWCFESISNIFAGKRLNFWIQVLLMSTLHHRTFLYDFCLVFSLLIRRSSLLTITHSRSVRICNPPAFSAVRTTFNNHTWLFAFSYMMHSFMFWTTDINPQQDFNEIQISLSKLTHQTK